MAVVIDYVSTSLLGRRYVTITEVLEACDLVARGTSSRSSLKSGRWKTPRWGMIARGPVSAQLPIV
jgi:hypothetical protein